MKEIKYILHAFLLLLAFIVIFTCLKTIFSIKEPESKTVLADMVKTETNVYAKGKALFQSKCGACHVLGRDFTGPSLCGFESRGPWSERKNVYQWIRYPQKFMSKFEYTQDLKNNFSNVMMQGFPDLTDEEIDDIINYINSACGMQQPKTEIVVD